MTENHVPIGTVKRDISKLVNRVAYGGERIVLTSRGEPKAAIVSLEDYEQLEQMEAEEARARWQAWTAERETLADEILSRRGGEPLDIETLWEAARADLEGRDAHAAGR
jgi:prevent-host-death family protein